MKRQSSLPKSNLRALRDEKYLVNLAAVLIEHADKLESAANKEDRRTRSIIRQLRRLARFYIDVAQQR